jgi:hypothetical protein
MEKSTVILANHVNRIAPKGNPGIYAALSYKIAGAGGLNPPWRNFPYQRTYVEKPNMTEGVGVHGFFIH